VLSSRSASPISRASDRVSRLFALLLMAAPAAHADLYRWVDPQTGSVKFSNVPPPASQPGVEVVPYTGPVPSRAGSGRPDMAALELRWRELLGAISQSQLSPGNNPEMQQRLREFAEVGAELDRLDPAGAPGRRAEAQKAMRLLLRDDDR
jgi:hypothetical protein